MTQVNLAHPGVGEDVLRRAGRQHLAEMQDVGALADVEGFADIVVGNQHPDAARLEQLDDVIKSRWASAPDYLIHQHQAALMQELLSDLQNVCNSYSNTEITSPFQCLNS